MMIKLFLCVSEHSTLWGLINEIRSYVRTQFFYTIHWHSLTFIRQQHKIGSLSSNCLWPGGIWWYQISQVKFAYITLKPISSGHKSAQKENVRNSQILIHRLISNIIYILMYLFSIIFRFDTMEKKVIGKIASNIRHTITFKEKC